MFKPLKQLLVSRGAESSGKLVQEITFRSASDVRARLAADTDVMSAAQLRGYLRARATQSVKRYTRIILFEHGLSTRGNHESLRSQALERTVHRLVGELTKKPAVAWPLRRAA